MYLPGGSYLERVLVAIGGADLAAVAPELTPPGNDQLTDGESGNTEAENDYGKGFDERHWIVGHDRISLSSLIYQLARV